MNSTNLELIDKIGSGGADEQLLQIYSTELAQAKTRYVALLSRHLELFGECRVIVVSAPGRTELGGNHTDHNLGIVLAGSVDLDSVAVVSKSGDSAVSIHSEGYDSVTFDSKDGCSRPEERETAAALFRGVLAGIDEMDYSVGGFNMVMDSRVLKGSGLSSSASVEILVGTAVSELFNDGKINYVDIARAGQTAENNFFGKASGLMDQLACAAGGIIGIDFKNPSAPEISETAYDFRSRGWELIVTDARCSHANLSDEYSAIPEEMKSIASFFGHEVCRQLNLTDLFSEIPALRERFGDRAVLRAYHFITESERAAHMKAALEADDLDGYLSMVNCSGNSSYKFLQNIRVEGQPEQQPLAVALALSEAFLGKEGASRIQGGGFAGTIQAYVPVGKVDSYIDFMESVFGAGCCSELRIRRKPACRIL